ncbi:MAG TPA: ATP-dependent DNA helicase RecG [Candidatus Paceibacterota bacterium]|nr:ATP-dependent DNA helicase RecG [Candidatus Paceibacterota bacterium]HPP64880.1 ATP-dependent DNA helicase RecG [Candidatus Paceibacterota bacterium]
MFELSDRVSKLKGVGPRYLKYLEKLNINTIKDLLWYFPFRYEDFSQIKKIDELKEGETVTIYGTISKISLRKSFRKKMFIIEAIVSDGSSTIKAIWFNQPYLLKTLKVNTTVSLSSKVKKQGKKLVLVSPAYEIISQQPLDKNFFDNLKHTARLVPIYPETKGLTSRGLRYLISQALKSVALPSEYLPFSILKKYQLLPLKIALEQIHFPDTLTLAQKAKERFVFESLFLSQLYLLKLKKQTLNLDYPKINLDVELLKSFVSSLPFSLTQDQKKTLWEISKNLNQSPMNRLLEGEVGSGKTLVAIGASLLVYKSDWQVAYLAPTEILAMQVYEKYKSFLSPFKVRIALLTSSGAKIFDDGLEGKISKKGLLRIISSSLPIIVIGTHALIQKNIVFEKLGLVIIDEQHRFGVEQRKKIIKETKTKKIPHVLSMTATPIPRTLALAFYGDLDLSIIRELPQERKKIITKLVLPEEREKVYQFIRNEVLKGRQVFVICPRIEETEVEPEKIVAYDLLTYIEKLNYEVKAVKKEYQKLKEEIFPDLKVEMLHGKMKSSEKEEIMKKFRNNEINILVSTSVVEVGIDILNATIMMIEGAEHFGLAQLHQFRGRVGRFKYQSYCFLFTENLSKSNISRLKSLEKYDDGFKLAEIDLSLRGPGQFLGTKQSGIPDLVMHSLIKKELMENVYQEAKKILETDSTLKKWPLLLKAFNEFTEKARRT